jgi:hypothetical protein
VSGIAQSLVVLIVSLAIYFTALAAFLAKGWPIRAGLTMGVAAFLPILWQVWFTDSDMPGFAFVWVLTFPPALIITLIGCLLCLMRLGRRLWTSRSASVNH